MCYVNTPLRTVPFGTCPLNVNTHTKTPNCGLCTSGLNDLFPLSQIVHTRLLDDFSRRHRIKHVLLIGRKPASPHRTSRPGHLDEFFVCLLNPVSVVAVSGVDQTVHSPEILSPSRLNPVLASRQAKLKFLRPNFVMVVTISPSFSLKRIVVCLAASCSTIKIPASVLPTKRSQIMVGNQTHGNQYATSCFALPGSARPRILSRTQRLFHTLRRRRTPLRSTVSRLPAKFTNPIQTSPRCFRSCCRYRRCCHCRTAATAL